MSRVGCMSFKGDQTREQILELIKAWFPDASNIKFEYRGEDIRARFECSRFDVVSDGETIPSYVVFRDFFQQEKLIKLERVYRSGI